MAITRKKKEEIVEKFEAGFANAKSIVFINFKGLTVAEVTELRKKLRADGVSYAVAKKTLVKKVLGGKGYEGEMPNLSGELAVAYGEDMLAPARGTFEFEKKFKEKLSIVGGVFEGKYKDGVAMKAIALIPSREVLLSQIAFLLKSPMQRLAVAVSEVAKKK